ncbi:hypothetical protein CXU13_04050 [Akkermansia muciniphila]|nr:hypothetical protein CXU13_04050 [Akkermansia muciniphila]
MIFSTLYLSDAIRGRGVNDTPSPGMDMLSPFFSSAVFPDGIADDIELPLHVMKVLQYQDHFQ